MDHDFILGRDFTGSSAKLLETPFHIYLTAEYDSTDPEDFWERAKHTCCDVPLLPHDKIPLARNPGKRVKQLRVFLL